jgi:predicted DNA binding protein
MEISTVPPEKRVSKLFLTNVGDNYRGRGLSQIIKNSKIRQQRSKTEAKELILDKRTEKQIDNIMGCSLVVDSDQKDLTKWVYQGKIELREDFSKLNAKPLIKEIKLLNKQLRKNIRTIKLKKDPSKQRFRLTKEQLNILKNKIKSGIIGHRSGTAHKNSKLSDKQINEMFKLIGEKVPYRAIAAKLGISKGAIDFHVKKHKTQNNQQAPYMSYRDLAKQFGVVPSTIFTAVKKIKEGIL